MANILQTINNFVTVSYDYLVDTANNISKHVSINSNSVPINITAAGNAIQTNASILYSYTVNPADAPKSTIVNSATVQTVFGSLATLAGSTKYANLQYADIGDNINYAVSIINNGSVDATDIVFTDALPQGVTFVSNSIMLDGIAITDLNANPTTGFNVGIIPAGMTRVVTFSVKVTSIPTSNNISNIAQFSYNFLINPNDPATSQSAIDTTGSAIITTISHADLSTAQTVVDKKAAQVGDILTYTTTIPNTGNADASNVVFNEYVPTKTQLVAGSISAIVNGASISVSTGNTTDSMINANLGTIPVGKQAVVSFKVKIIN